jgi:hypothetical protein
MSVPFVLPSLAAVGAVFITSEPALAVLLERLQTFLEAIFDGGD